MNQNALSNFCKARWLNKVALATKEAEAMDVDAIEDKFFLELVVM